MLHLILNFLELNIYRCFDRPYGAPAFNAPHRPITPKPPLISFESPFQWLVSLAGMVTCHQHCGYPKTDFLQICSAPFGAQQQPAGNAFGTKPSGTFGSAININTAPSQPSGFSWGPSTAQSTALSTSNLFQTQKPATPVQTQPGASTLGWNTLQTTSA